MEAVGGGGEAGAASDELDVGDEFLSLVGLAFFQTLADEMLDTFEAVLAFLREVDFRGHEELPAEDDLILIWKFEGCLVGMLVIGYSLVPVLEQVAVLVLDLPHDLECAPFVHAIG